MIVQVERLVAGGAGLAREPGGRIVLVDGAAPGDEVRVHPVRSKRDVVRAEIDEVLSPSPGRREPPCPEVAAGCGGCDWQHLTELAQRAGKVDVVVDALRRLGGVDDPVVRLGPSVPLTAYRTTVRALVVDGRVGFRARASHDPVPVRSCLVAHPAVDEILREGRFGSAHEVTVRVGARTGERLVLVDPSTAGVSVPADVTVVGRDQLRRGAGAAYHEEVAGRRWRISARSFAQPCPEGAEALVDVAGELAGDALGAGPLVDLYGGVGLFAGALGVEARRRDPALGITVVERHRDAVADARQNLSDLGAGVRFRTVDVERWRPEPAHLVIADPAREGLRSGGVRAVVGSGADRLVLVSCDAAALGRDARLLAGAGFASVESVVVDQFGMTSHVEVVTRFDRR
jgi:23S rRNA (uracil1939-C5)-methyltransferase